MTPHASLRLVCALGVALVAVALAGAPAFASPTPTPTPTPTVASDALTPLVDCVQDAPLGAVTSRTVVLGYRSSASAPVTVTPGSGDDLSPGAADRGQPSTFLPGEHHGAWLLTVDAAAEPSLTWTLGSRSLVIDSTAPACTDATALVLSAPTASSGTVSVSATVTRFLLGAPEVGTVAFSVDGVATTAPVGPGGVARADLTAPAGAHTITATFTPASGSTLRPATATAAVTVTAPSGALTVAADSVVTGSKSVTVHVTRTGASAPVTVDFATVDGTAHAGPDYVAASGTLALAAGQAAATATLSLPVRAAGSPASVFFVVLQHATADVSGAVAMVSLPAVPAAAPASVAAGGTGGGGAATAASALPQGDPTAHTPIASAPVGQDLLLLLGAGLITIGGFAGVIGLVRSVRTRDAF
ncbi:Calx-beta domain-containing protein [Leifsonia sp. NPDC056824]|uniref:Calx-beta domain-containing protein n=1 Tax=Leifsonia sp. NPDC056824 TaxID=3345953 RepID=UPI0036BB43C2